MNDKWEDQAAGWDDNEDVRYFADQAFASLLKHVNLRDGEWKSRRVFDFGCGTGLLTEKIAPFVGEVVALDTAQSMIEVLRKKSIANVTAVCGDFSDPKVQTSAWCTDFDLIVASSVCGFLPNYESTLTRFLQILTPTGHFAQWDWLASDGEEGMTLERIASAFRAAGFRQDVVEQAFSIEFDDGELVCLAGIASAT